jgi:hypothetical protein
MSVSPPGQRDGPVDVGREADAVAHRGAHLAHDGDPRVGVRGAEERRDEREQGTAGRIQRERMATSGGRTLV